jgi:hypothetical protein
MDVEGAEFEVVAAARQLDAASTYWGEVHATPDDERTQRMLAAFGGFDVDVHAEGDVTLFTAVRGERRTVRPRRVGDRPTGPLRGPEAPRADVTAAAVVRGTGRQPEMTT